MKPWFRVLGFLVAAVVCAGTIAAAIWLFERRSGVTRAMPEKGAAGGSAEEGGVVCFGYVDLEHGVRSLSPVQPGRVAEVLVRETDTVPAGAVLLRLEDDLARVRVEQAEAAVEAARVQLAQAQLLPQKLKSRAARQEEAIEAIHRRLSAAGHTLLRKQKLDRSDLINAEEVAVAADQVKELEALERAELERLNELRLQEPALEIRRAEAEVNLSRARLEEARQILDQYTLKAPQAGTVLRLLAGPGAVLSGQPNHPALMFCPSEPCLVRAEVEQEFAERVQEGQDAKVEDDVRTGKPYRGRVIRVSNWFTQRRAILAEPLQPVDVRTVECLIALDADPTGLRIGQRVRVTIGRKTP